MSVTAEYGADCTVLNALTYTENDFFGSKLLAHNELVEKFLACFSNSLFDSLTQTLKSVAHIGERSLFYTAVCAVFISLVVKKINISICLTVNNVRNNNRANGRTECSLQTLEYTIETGAFIAKTVYKKHLCKPCLCCRFNCLFCAYTNTVLTRNNDKCRVSRSHALCNTACKIKKTWGVDEVDFCIFPFNRCNRRHN